MQRSHRFDASHLWIRSVQALPVMAVIFRAFSFAAAAASLHGSIHEVDVIGLDVRGFVAGEMRAPLAMNSSKANTGELG